jgi:hypothetical protein
LALKLILIPVAVLIVASLFNPITMSIQNQQIGNNVNLALGVNATLLYPNTSYQNSTACGVVSGSWASTINSWATVLENDVAGFFNWILTPITGGASIVPPAQCTPNYLSGIAQSAGTTFNNKYFYFNPYSENSNLMFITLIGAIIAIGVISGISIVSSGLNAGATFILVVGSGLILLWMSLSGNTSATFQSIPYNYGSLLYALLTISYTIGSLQFIAMIRE